MDLVNVANWLSKRAGELRQEADRYDAVANDIICLTPGDTSTSTPPPSITLKKKRKISAKGRAAIRKAQKTRWAKYKKQNVLQMKKRA